jgi:hypothetical protein
LRVFEFHLRRQFSSRSPISVLAHRPSGFPWPNLLCLKRSLRNRLRWRALDLTRHGEFDFRLVTERSGSTLVAEFKVVYCSRSYVMNQVVQRELSQIQRRLCAHAWKFCRVRSHRSNRIFSWSICESYDDKGNAIRYQYKSENSDGVDLSAANERNRNRSAQRYLKRIKYGNKTPRQPNENIALRSDWMFEVVFDYGDHYTESSQSGSASTATLRGAL